MFLNLFELLWNLTWLWFLIELKIRICFYFWTFYLFIVNSPFQIFIPYVFIYNQIAFSKWRCHPFFSEGNVTNLVSLLESRILGYSAIFKYVSELSHSQKVKSIKSERRKLPPLLTAYVSEETVQVAYLEHYFKAAFAYGCTRCAWGSDFLKLTWLVKL